MIVERLLQTFILISCILLIGFYFHSNHFRRTKSLFKTEPNLMLWAWEYPADMRFVNAKTTGIAYLAAKIRLSDNEVVSVPRMQTLLFPASAYKMAVIRIESSRKNPATLSDQQLDGLVLEITRVMKLQKADALQIDFDAKQNEREFYQRLMKRLHFGLLDSKPISMTSLASWCLSDTWIRSMPCEEVVPMFFSMGAARNEAIALMKKNGLAKMPMQVAIGLSVDEPDVWQGLQSDQLPRRVYLFASHGWGNPRVMRYVVVLEHHAVSHQ